MMSTWTTLKLIITSRPLPVKCVHMLVHMTCSSTVMLMRMIALAAMSGAIAWDKTMVSSSFIHSSMLVEGRVLHVLVEPDPDPSE